MIYIYKYYRWYGAVMVLVVGWLVGWFVGGCFFCFFFASLPSFLYSSHNSFNTCFSSPFPFLVFVDGSLIIMYYSLLQASSGA
jgi:hypothetical protein